jgi:hypothetical protein
MGIAAALSFAEGSKKCTTTIEADEGAGQVPYFEGFAR